MMPSLTLAASAPNNTTTPGTLQSLPIATTAEIIAELRAGRMVVIADAEDRENEGDLLMAAEAVTPEAINFMARFGRGLICLTLTEARCRELDLQQMVSDNRTPHGTAFTVSIEAATGVTTGISAADRARTVLAAVARNAKPADIVQPGHIFPLTAKNGGVLARAGHTEAGCDFAELAGYQPASVICEILRDDGEMARMPDLIAFAAEHGLKVGTIANLIKYRSETEQLVDRVGDKLVSTPHGEFRLTAYHDRATDNVHLALSTGEINPAEPTLVRVHEPYSALDWFDFDETRHSYSVNEALQLIRAKGAGVLVLLTREQTAAEQLARFQPPAAPARASRWDPRLFGTAAQMLRDLNVGKMRILAHPKKIPSMAGFGLEITEYVVPAVMPAAVAAPTPAPTTRP